MGWRGVVRDGKMNLIGPLPGAAGTTLRVTQPQAPTRTPAG